MEATDELRRAVRDLLDEVWSPDLTVGGWWDRLADDGLSQPTWPAPYGRGASRAAGRAVLDELASAGAVAPPAGLLGAGLAGPTILAHGTPAQQERHLWPLLRGRTGWCQLFSEPGAGSDLPALQARAARDGRGWRVTGQKVWSSGADRADRAMLLARTGPPGSRSRGITYLLLDLHQPGVEVRPLVTMTGAAPFCEVFLDGAWVDDADRVGAVDGGWLVARATLAFERVNTTGRPPGGLVVAPPGAAHLRVGDLVAGAAPPRAAASALPARRHVALAAARGRTTDPAVRDGLVGYRALTDVARLTRQRLAAGGATGADASLVKLAQSEVCRRSRDLSLAVLGAEGMLAGEVQTVALSSPGVSIGGGTDEIQRNAIAERALGLPRDPGAP